MSHPSPTPLIPHLWGTYVPPWSPHGMEQLHADGQPEGTALAERLRAQTGLLWWTASSAPVPVMLPHGGFCPPCSSCGVCPLHKRMVGVTGMQRSQGSPGSREHWCSPELPRRVVTTNGSPMLQGGVTQVTTGASNGCHLLGSQEADASPRHRLWPHFIQPHVSKSTLRCTPTLQSGVCGETGHCQR